MGLRRVRKRRRYLKHHPRRREHPGLLKNTTSNTIKISDFGMAKDTNVSSMPKTKRIGTIAYMAPEVADATSGYSGAPVDVWSMGVMLYVMVYCNYPFGHDGDGGDPTRTVLQRIRSGTFQFSRAIAISGATETPHYHHHHTHTPHARSPVQCTPN